MSGAAKTRERLPGRADAAGVPSVGTWTLLCASAEGLGMTAAAGAAKVSQGLVGEPSSRPEVALVLSLAVAGGLIEGVALGVLQAAGLRRWLPGPRARRWVLVTVAVAGVGWAAASAPGAFAGPGDATAPALPVVLGGAASLGAAMGVAGRGASAGPAGAGALPGSVGRCQRGRVGSRDGRHLSSARPHPALTGRCPPWSAWAPGRVWRRAPFSVSSRDGSCPRSTVHLRTTASSSPCCARQHTESSTGRWWGCACAVPAPAASSNYR